MTMVSKTEAEFHSLGTMAGGEVHIGGGETDAMHLVAEVIREIRKEYPGIHFHGYSGNAEDVTERLDKGLLDFGVLIPAGIGAVLVVLSLLLCAGLNDTAYYPSTADLNSSLTIANSCSSEFTLSVMSVVSLIIPFVLAYIAYVWRKMDKKS